MKKVFALVLLLLVTSCAVDPVSTEYSDNPKVQVSLLFTHEGCKVYRFYDSGRHHYYTDCGETMSTQSCGKSCTQQENIR